ncbi:metal-sensing transcriptional repressor [Aquabacterium sp.]|jgi:DNA-binding FrmR family transcriptional regulator|uniref:metal-sensing transcriptional repressor n=1 Tax=Aquabacterium sp. TaxID=1872578 RepID=UPI001D7A3A89|nr:metal-sensing transcriptional repressor [Aquabacterium sp.]MBT9609234.1 metal-sensing transcriptional repressor [Aquabacterium sp.]|tara:strand:- start:322 stop:642 length:321 start_codon:yes stop_codon:yes gene_type:complete
MTTLDNDARTDILNRLKRAEGQLRGIQRMIEAGEPCQPVAVQMSAVRKALDSTWLRMVRCLMAQELNERLGATDTDDAAAPASAASTPEVVDAVLDQMEAMLGKLR